MDTKLHFLVVTGIIRNKDKYLIVKRAGWEKAFPNMWCVPGGKLDQKDYINKKKATADHWCYVLNTLLEREIKEETNLEIKNIGYLMDICYIRSDGFPTLILSLYCDYSRGKVKLSDSLSDFAWVKVSDLKKYDLISGIREQIELVDKVVRLGKKHIKWKGKYESSKDKSKRDGI